MRAISHAQAQKMLHAVRPLNANDRAALDAHLAGCPECRAYAGLHERLAVELPRAYPARRASERELREKIRAAQAGLEHRRGAWLALRLAQSALAMAAVLALAAGLGYLAVRTLPQAAAGGAEQAREALQAAAPAAHLVEETEDPTAPAPVMGAPSAPDPTPTSTACSRDAAPLEPLPTPSPSPIRPVPFADVQAQLGGAVSGVTWQGHTAYIGAGPYLEAIDLTVPAQPRRIVGGPLLPDPVSKVISIPPSIQPGLLAAYGRRVGVFDISDPLHIDQTGEVILPGKVVSLLVDLNALQAFAAGPLEGRPDASYLARIDLRRFDAPILAGSVTVEEQVTSLALERPWLYAGTPRGVLVVEVENDRFGEPERTAIELPVYSMTAVRGQLTVGSNGALLAYDAANPRAPRLLWEITQTGGGEPLGLVYSFELRASQIYAAGFYPGDSRPPFRLALTPPGPNRSGSVVDTAAYLSVGNGLMLVTGDRAGGGLEIYEAVDPLDIRRIAAYLPED